MDLRHRWQHVRDNRLLTKCIVAKKGDPPLEMHIHSWRFSPNVREVWYVAPFEDRDGLRRVHVVPEDKIYEVFEATSHEHAMAIIRSGESA
jgi:hypothetical protein